MFRKITQQKYFSKNKGMKLNSFFISCEANSNVANYWDDKLYFYLTSGVDLGKFLGGGFPKCYENVIKRR